MATGQMQSGVDVATCVVFEERVEVPMRVRSLEDFRRWATSGDFPDRGRIDYISGRIEVDMSPENVFFHGALKVELIRLLSERVKRANIGNLFTDSMRISCPAAALSVEPDLVLISHAGLKGNRIRLVPAVAGKQGSYIEFEGSPDLVVEIVSDSSVAKDTKRLPVAYWAAGVEEFWLADARGEQMIFQIHHRGETRFEPVVADLDGFQKSNVLKCGYRLERHADDRGNWAYDLIERS
jgi:Uma2 family endonuclease